MRRALDSRLDRIAELLERLQLLLMVREPATGMAADAYEGLRKQVVASASERTAHLSQLARLDSEVARGASLDAISILLSDLMAETGLIKLDVPTDGAFDVVGGDGDGLEVLEPAYVEAATGRIVRRGKAQAIAEAGAELAPADPAGELPQPTDETADGARLSATEGDAG